MAEWYGKKVVYSADDEMPDCMICDNCDSNFNCIKNCGAKYGWSGYQRTEWIEEGGDNNG